MTVNEVDFSALPESLKEQCTRHWQVFLAAGGILPKRLQALLPRVWAGSDFVAEQMARQPELATWLASEGVLDTALSRADWQAELQAVLAGVEDETALARQLRKLRNRQMCRIIWRDLAARGNAADASNRVAGSAAHGAFPTGYAGSAGGSRADTSANPYADTVADLSLMAQSLVDAALDKLMAWTCEQQSAPLDDRGDAVRLVVLAMGKLGAGELNLSSDIDLVFAYEHEGEVSQGTRSISFNQFFVRLGQRLIRVLDQVTADGFVFRVDMRLRPWGKSGTLAIGFDAMENYYEREGREWERYALVKMRPIAGDIDAGMRLIERLRPFVYRRYIDYGAFQHLRDMKALIEREVRRNGSQQDVKLGAGGIREVEFVVQAFQLIRGGQLPALQEPNLLKVLALLPEFGLLPLNMVEQLQTAYLFLRNVEHCLQALADKQTQRLPADDSGWERLAYSMGYADVTAFEQQLQVYRQQVRRHFDNVVADNNDGLEDAEGINHELSELWQGRLDETPACMLLASIGIEDEQALILALADFRSGRAVANMQPLARARLDRLMPRLIEVLAYQGEGVELLDRLLVFLEAVLRRSAYIALLVENPSALSQLVKLSAASSFIAGRLTQYPFLLEELLDVRALYSPPARQQLADELRQHLLRLPESDLEQQMDALRNFKQAHLLRVAACEATESLPLMRVSDYLTWLAEVILEQVVQLAWDNLVARHGTPQRADGSDCDPDFIIVAYGKLGSLELGHKSDIDLVFLHDATSDGQTDGAAPLPNESFFARLGQRIIHILTTRTLNGPLYEVDIRLRPSGASGLLVTSLTAFGRYQREQAWVWEQQALVRARAVAGDAALGRRFEALRSELLCCQRDPVTLRQEVLAMRERMLAEHDKNRDKVFNLKQGAGGIVDIEFMVQYGVLRWAYQYPKLTAYTDNVRLLETLAALDLMSAQDAGLLREAYLAFRSAAHSQSLKDEPASVPIERFAELRSGVTEIWQRWFVGRGAAV